MIAARPVQSDTLPLDEQTMMQAMMQGDATYDGAFYTGVRTTGIYCRPSCASRKPKAENVVFFSLPEVAELAGFRACKRCRPQDVEAADPQVELVRDACRRIAMWDDGVPSLSELASVLHISPYHLQRQFTRYVGVSPRRYAEACRSDAFKESLSKGLSVTDALYSAGYGSGNRVYGGASSVLGMAPMVYQRHGAGTEIAYALAESSLGVVLVAATSSGVCSIKLGDDRLSLEEELKTEFRKAERIERDDEKLKGHLESVLGYLAGRSPDVRLPLDVRATAFQRQVWECLQSIPVGETRTYSEVAKAIGSPDAARAVASACARNPVPLAVPCHRVVRKDGGLGGYRWGLERKNKLLSTEKKRT